MKAKTNSGVRLLLGILVTTFLLGTNTWAATSISPFTGTSSETWESFNDYLTGPHYLAAPTSIMGGAAFISSSLMSVYLTNSATSFGLGDSGNAQVSDGVKGMGLDGFAQTATITFVNPVTDFGAYWGANTPPTPATVSLLFSDGSLESFTYSAPHDGTLIWHGWHFETGITSISYSGDFVAVDGLQANVIPEPSTALLGVLGVGLLLLHRRHYSGGRDDDFSRDRREFAVATNILATVEPKFSQISVTELVHALKLVPRISGGDFGGVAGYVYAIGNSEIIKQIQSRPKDELSVLPSLADDKVEVYEGPRKVREILWML